MTSPQSSRQQLLAKYNVQGPRYTSYPTVPYWQDSPTADEWLSHLRGELTASQTRGEGAALYLHIPFCEQLCTFCGCNKRITKKYEMSRPYIEAIHREWALYKQGLGIDNLPVTDIHIGGGTPTFLSADELRMLMEGILPDIEKMPNQTKTGAEFAFEADPRVTTLTQLKALYDLGFRRLSLGIQDYDPKVQDIVNRVQSPDDVKALTDGAREVGYTSINYDLIYGLPLQTRASVEMTMAHVIADRPDRIAYYSYAHVPWIGGTGQRKFSEDDLPSGEEKRALYELGRTMLESAGYREIGLDHFALESDSLWQAVQNKTLFRNFMGYTPHHVSPMIGLGCSSISDAWTMFAQNAKEVEEYQDIVARGELPIFRGHILSDEDRVIRRHILNLMTQMETSWSEAEAFTDHLLQVPGDVQEFANDNLIELQETALTIHEVGRPFLRNVCMAFDARLARDKPDRQIFSATI